MSNFLDLFNDEKPIIGMIHLAGAKFIKTDRALREAEIYSREGVSGVIVEDYHGGLEDVFNAFSKIKNENLGLTLGLNILRDPLYSFNFANDFGADFIQVDSVQHTDININKYGIARRNFPKIPVIGGVRFKYKTDPGTPLNKDLKDAMKRCEAICTTGEGTGLETPLEKLVEFKEVIEDFPLVIGAGVNSENVQEQLRVADAAIVGSYFKGGKTQNMVNPKYVRRFMEKVKEIR